MGFFEFEDEFFEAAAPSPSPSKPASRPGTSSGTAAPRGSTPSPASGGGRTGPSSGRGATPPASPTQPGATTPRAAPQGGRDAGTPPPSGRPSPTRPSDPSGGFSFDRFMPYLTQGVDLVQRGTQIAQQFGPSPGARGPAPGDAGQPPGGDGQTALPPAGYGPAEPMPQASGYDVGAAPSPYGSSPTAQPAPSADQLAILLQALRQRQIPPLPGPVSPPVTAPAPTVPQSDALGLLRLIVGNPQFQQALQLSAVMGSAGPRSVQLPVPAPWPPHRPRPTPVPLGAVMNAIAALAGQSMVELNARTAEDDPEVPSYLVDEEGEFVVDPASPDDRAALVAHLFRVSDEARRADWRWSADGQLSDAGDEHDESDVFAREAGFMDVRTR